MNPNSHHVNGYPISWVSAFDRPMLSTGAAFDNCPVRAFAGFCAARASAVESAQATPSSSGT